MVVVPFYHTIPLFQSQVRIFIFYQSLMRTKWDPIVYYFYCTLMLFLVGLKMAGHGQNM